MEDDGHMLKIEGKTQSPWNTDHKEDKEGGVEGRGPGRDGWVVESLGVNMGTKKTPRHEHK